MRNAHIKNFQAHENLSSFQRLRASPMVMNFISFLSECGEDCERMKTEFETNTEIMDNKNEKKRVGAGLSRCGLILGFPIILSEIMNELLNNIPCWLIRCNYLQFFSDEFVTKVL